MEDIEVYIKNHYELLCKRNIFVAVSGGVDSMTLLHIANKLFPEVQAVHVNYGLRGADSNADEQHVRSYCEKHGIATNVKSVKLHQGNIQSEARKARYTYFEQLLSMNPNSVVFLGHNADDQIETFYQNLARKSGVMGLACMLEKNDPYFRPLLSFSRNQIVEYANSAGVSWREDQSNYESKYERNKLRNLILPGLHKELSELKESVLLMIDQFQKLQKKLEDDTAAIRDQIQTKGELPFSAWEALSELEQIALFATIGLDHKVVAKVNKLDQKGKLVELTDNFNGFNSIIRDTDHFDFYKKEAMRLPELIIEEINELPTQFHKDELFVDPAKIEGELKIRGWRIGDRIKPVGMSGSQLVSDILSDAKYDQAKKEKTFVITDDKDILWIPGLKVGRKAIPDETVKSPLLRISII